MCLGYVAGFVDPEIINRSDLFDVFVNLSDNEITIAQHAKGKTVKNKPAAHNVNKHSVRSNTE